LKPILIDGLVAHINNYASSSPSARVEFARARPEIAPVLAYFQTKYNERLSDVVVILAPLATVPHTGGSGTIYGSALGAFIPPMALPVAANVRLPLSDLYRDGERGSSIEGQLQMTVDNQQQIVLDGLAVKFGSSKLIYVNPEAIRSNTLTPAAFQATVAHEFRHLIDFYSCLNPSAAAARSTVDYCDPVKIEQDWAATQAEASSKQAENLAAFWLHPDTRMAFAELAQLYQRYRTGESGAGSSVEANERAARAGIQSIFEQNYRSYPHLFSIKERRGYREQLLYLVDQGKTSGQAVQAAIGTMAPARVSVQISGAQSESITTPGFPWIEDLFRELLRQQ
jgi:hypothetical protein